MPHELRGLTEQSAEFYAQLAVAGLVLFVVVVAAAYYLHRKHAHLLKPRPPRVREGAALRKRRKRGRKASA